jgi:hypothetical protein
MHSEGTLNLHHKGLGLPGRCYASSRRTVKTCDALSRDAALNAPDRIHGFIVFASTEVLRIPPLRFFFTPYMSLPQENRIELFSRHIKLTKRWRPDLAGFDSRLIFEGVLIEG